jgi:septal ring factor EnvC (AmiA/AmiB activator)
MRIISEQDNPITYDMRDVVTKILQVLKEDQSLNFGPRLNATATTKKTIEATIASKRQLLKKSKETLNELEVKLAETKESNDTLREELLESLGSQL